MRQLLRSEDSTNDSFSLSLVMNPKTSAQSYIARKVYPILVTSIVKTRQTRVFTKSGHHLFVTIKRTLAEVSVLTQI